MSGCRCSRPRAAGEIGSPSRPRAISHPVLSRLCDAALWAVPAVVLALLPKCPVCLAAWIAVLSGIGVTLPVAASIRWALVAASVVAMACLAVRQAARLART